MSESRMVERFEDMSPDGRLIVIRQPDGDVIISIAQNERDREMGWNPSVEFCTSGGRSPHTSQALYDLFAAIERDNAETPITWKQGTPWRADAYELAVEALKAVIGSFHCQRCQPGHDALATIERLRQESQRR